MSQMVSAKTSDFGSVCGRRELRAPQTMTVLRLLAEFFDQSSLDSATLPDSDARTMPTI
jgi:hypothetical protein